MISLRRLRIVDKLYIQLVMFWYAMAQISSMGQRHMSYRKSRFQVSSIHKQMLCIGQDKH
jgi:hypothetical protein